MEFVDIHTHILPAVDDGARDVSETVAMLELAHRAGTRRIVATPHMFQDLFAGRDAAEIRRRFEDLLAELEGHRAEHGFLSEIELFLGAENYASAEFLEALEHGFVLTLNDSRYLLVEFYPGLPFRQLESVVDRIQVAGCTPVLAHPERLPALQENIDRAGFLREQGCVLAVNVDSAAGGGGKRAAKCARKLMAQGLVDVIATDAHRPDWRPPVFDGVLTGFRRRQAREDLGRWLVGNPSRILRNEDLEPR